jgi:CheY-like chemotaxis protein
MSTYTKRAIGRKALANAVVLQNHRAFGPCAVGSLATDGITFLGNPVADLTPGEVTVVLTVPEGRLMKLQGFFRKTDVASEGASSWHVGFRQFSPDVEDSIQELIVEQLERARVPLIVALDCGRLSQTRLRRDLCRLGRDIVFFDNALEALWFMDDSPDGFSAILVDSSFLRANGPEVLSFLRDTWRDKRCLLACNRAVVSNDEIQALRSSVHGILDMPWTQTSLATSLGILPAGPSTPLHRILFVDDEPAVLQALQQRMRKYLVGCEAIWDASGLAEILRDAVWGAP